MDRFWIPLQTIPAQTGLTVEYTDQDIWSGMLQEVLSGCKSNGDLRASVVMLPQEAGILFRGSLTGSLTMACNRCMEDSLFTLKEEFDSFESFPAEADQDDDNAENNDAIIRLSELQRDIEVNPFALAWQELCLALPLKPLCTDTCKGLCQKCGSNLNTGSCGCETGSNDPRLAPLRGLQLKK